MIKQRIPLFFDLIKAAAKVATNEPQRSRTQAAKENSQFEGFEDDDQGPQSDDNQGPQSDDDQGPQTNSDKEGGSSSEDDRPISISSTSSSEIYESDEA